MQTSQQTITSDDKCERLSVRLPFDCAEQLRVICSTEGRSPSDAIAEALDGWLFMRPQSAKQCETQLKEEKESIQVNSENASDRFVEQDNNNSINKRVSHPRKGETCFYVRSNKLAFFMQQQTDILMFTDLCLYLAKNIGCDVSVVRRILRGDRPMSQHDLNLVEKAVGKSIKEYTDQTKYSITSRDRRIKERQAIEKRERQARAKKNLSESDKSQLALSH